MTNTLRFTAAAVLALAATPALAAVTPVAPTKQATASAKIVKPLTISWVQDLDLGTITLVGSASTTLGIAQDGTTSCPGTEVTCSGTMKVAKYHLTGVNNQVVNVTAGNVTMTNANSDQLLLSVDAPPSVTLPNSGASGTDFSIGGNVTVSGATPEGAYQGTFAVTVNY
jgi:hypothetical protein